MTTIWSACIWIMCILGLAPAVAQAQDFESPPVLQAAELAPADVPLKDAP